MDIVELGCNTGMTSRELADHFPKITILGLDICEDVVQTATKEAAEKGLNNVKYAVQDICNLPPEWTNKWEFIYCIDVIHDVPKTTQVIREIHRILKPGGQAFIIDVNLHTNVAENKDNPFASGKYTISLFHCMPVSLYGEGGEGLGNAWGKEKATQMFKEGGFKEVKILDETGTRAHFLVIK